jgi:tetratricopeptide (TPR) repeat protein
VYIAREKNQKEAALEQARASAAAAEEQRQQAEANLRLARQAVDDIYTRFAQQLADQPHMQPLERELLQKVLEFYREFARQKSTDPEIRLGTGRAQLRVGEIQYRLGHGAEAEAAYGEAILLLDQLAGEHPVEPRYRSALAYAHNSLGFVLESTHRMPEAKPAYRSAITLLSKLMADHPDKPEYRAALAGAYCSLGHALLSEHPQDAEMAYRRAIALGEKLVADFPGRPLDRERLVSGLVGRSRLQEAAARYLEAEESLRQALTVYQGAAGPLNACYCRYLLPEIYLALARVLGSEDRKREAEEACRQAIGLFEKYVADFPSIPSYWKSLFAARAYLVRLLQQEGRFEEAAQVYQQALDLCQRLTAEMPDEAAFHQLVLRLFQDLSGMLEGNSRREGCQEAYRRAGELSEKLAARYPTRSVYSFYGGYWHSALGSLLTATGRSAEAGVAYRRAVALYGAALDRDPNHVHSLNNVAWLLATCPDASVRDAARAAELARKAIDLAPPRPDYLWNTLGLARYRAGDWKAAVAALEKSMALFAARPEPDRMESYSTFFLAMAYWQLGDKQKAREWLDRAVRWMEQYRPADEELRRFRAEAAALLEK